MKILLSLSVAVLLTTGCVQRAVDRFNQIDKAAEPETDALLGFAIDRICRVPMDVMARNIADDPYKALAAWAACLEVRQVYGTIDSLMKGQPIVPAETIDLLTGDTR